MDEDTGTGDVRNKGTVHGKETVKEIELVVCRNQEFALVLGGSSMIWKLQAMHVNKKSPPLVLDCVSIQSRNPKVSSD